MRRELVRKRLIQIPFFRGRRAAEPSNRRNSRNYGANSEETRLSPPTRPGNSLGPKPNLPAILSFACPIAISWRGRGAQMSALVREGKAPLPASAYVWALVAGLPSTERGSRRAMILEAYLDDSGSGGRRQRFFTLAGFLSDYESWGKFADEWKAVLDE